MINLSAFESSRQQTTGQLSVSAPLGSRGLRWTSSVAHTLYTLPSTSADGKADVGTLGIAYPLVRSLDSNWVAVLDGKAVHSSVDMLGINTSNKSLYAGQLSITGDSGDRAIQGGNSYWSGSVSLLMGDVRDGAALADPGHQLGHYAKLSYDALRKQNLTTGGEWYLLMRARGQLTSGNMDGYEKLGVGGATGVRAFGGGEGSLDEGVLATLALARRFTFSTGDQLAPNLFIDYVNGYANHSAYASWQSLSGYRNSTLSNHRVLAGYGIGIDWVSPHRLLLNLSWSRRFATSSSAINDPANAGAHVWLTLGYRF
ncbi:hypothetical protein [Cupriavidus sp. D39]|uniref:hypothetical protein n=1 Tax=Cupriavidus sp. D39 TaxID=2997877 RepID=UPI00226E3F29|nr:hypothetical protein [Cupriavidus sp. D39]MCY0858763.1 hypothetical protein [Cupriavidus sp. D39]